MAEKFDKYIPEIKGTLRSHIIEVPKVIREASGIKVFGKRLKSFIFTSDVSVIRNNNADAVMAVYPFTPQPVIIAALLLASDVPVFCDVGGSITTGKRVVNLALNAEFKGSMGVVIDSSSSNETIRLVRETIDIPIVVTVISKDEDIQARIDAGATILNVSAGKETVNVVKLIREKYKDIPIIATGGKDDEAIRNTILAGANAISYNPPSVADIFKDKMVGYRKVYEKNND